MSILMDALKQQQPAVVVQSHFWRNLAILLGFILALALGFIAGYWLLPHTTPSPATATPPAATPTLNASPAVIAETLATPVVEAEPEAVPVTPAPSPVEEVLAAAPAMVSLTANTARAEPVDDPQVSAELRERFASALAETAGKEPNVNRLVTHSAPAQDISLLDMTLQRQLPKLRFEAHVYATQPSQRWVKVNGKSLQEGQWITADVRLREITPQYVLLEFGQQLFSMRALSEW